MATGCRLFDAAWRTTVAEPLRFSRHTYEKMSRRHFLDVAKLALEQAIADARAQSDQYNHMPFSEDYQAGFLDGYVDYLEAGGNGAVQPTPPRRYWKARYQNSDGFWQMEQWVLGFQHGTHCAMASNYRSYVVLPLGDQVTMDTTPYPYGRMHASQEGSMELPETDPVADDVPADRYTSEPERSVPELRNSYEITQLPALPADEDWPTYHAANSR